MFKRRLKIGISIENCIRMVGLHLLFEQTHFGLDVVDFFESRQSGRVNSFTGSKIDVLIEQTEA